MDLYREKVEVVFFSLKTRQDREVLLLFLERISEVGFQSSRHFLVLLDDIHNFADVSSIYTLLNKKENLTFIAATRAPLSENILNVESLTLHPFSFRELLNGNKILNKQSMYSAEALFTQYMTFGGMPEVVSQNPEEKDMCLKEIEGKIIRTLAETAGISPLQIKSIIILLLRWVGKPLDIGLASLSLDMTKEEFEAILYFLEASGLFFLVRRHQGLESDQVKLYFFDTGLLKMFAHPDEGALFENAVFLQLRQYGHLEYAMHTNWKEIDFILNKTQAFEVKNKFREDDYIEYEKLAMEIGFEDFQLIVKEFHGEKKGVLYAEFL